MCAYVLNYGPWIWLETRRRAQYHHWFSNCSWTCTFSKYTHLHTLSRTYIHLHTLRYPYMHLYSLTYTVLDVSECKNMWMCILISVCKSGACNSGPRLGPGHCFSVKWLQGVSPFRRLKRTLPRPAGAADHQYPALISKSSGEYLILHWIARRLISGQACISWSVHFPVRIQDC